MHSTVDLAVERAASGITRVSRLGHDGALAARITGTGPEVTVHLVGAAAGPMRGDTTQIDVAVAAGASLRLCSVAAAIALPRRPGDGDDAPAGIALRVSVADGARFRLDLQPTIVTAGGSLDLSTTVDAHPGARLWLREQLVSGRHGEPGGAWNASLEVIVSGSPLLRQRTDHRTSPARVLLSQLALGMRLGGPDATGAVGDASCGAVTCCPSAGGVTNTAWGPDLVSARRAMAQLEGRRDAEHAA